MPVQFRIQFGSLPKPNPFYSLLNPLCTQKSYLSKTLTPKIGMVTRSSPSKRPICPKCLKPTQICLCTRLKIPALRNSVAVTILQHSLEKKHPLNSTRIATLGLENVDVISVSDVNFQARFVIHLLDRDHKVGLGQSEEKRGDFAAIGSGKRKCNFVERSVPRSGHEKSSDFEECSDSPEEKRAIFGHPYGEFSESIDFDRVTSAEFSKVHKVFLREKSSLLTKDSVHSELDIELGGEECIGSRRICDLEIVRGTSERDENAGSLGADMLTKNLPLPCISPNGAVSGDSEDAVIAFTIEKYGSISSFYNHWISNEQCEEKKDFDHLLASRPALERLGKGFGVKKLQRKQTNETAEYEEFEESGITVPPGSVLLFPSEKSVGIEAIDFEVKNLIVLDGTWAKAKRMYSENPWLKLLPHLKLSLDKLSLYSEVRHQPKAGFLSTIESIVYALKAFGEDSEKLDGLLEVFESMVGDQRRCKDERLSRVSTKPTNS